MVINKHPPCRPRPPETSPSIGSQLNRLVIRRLIGHVLKTTLWVGGPSCALSPPIFAPLETPGCLSAPQLLVWLVRQRKLLQHWRWKSRTTNCWTRTHHRCHLLNRGARVKGDSISESVFRVGPVSIEFRLMRRLCCRWLPVPYCSLQNRHLRGRCDLCWCAPARLLVGRTTDETQCWCSHLFIWAMDWLGGRSRFFQSALPRCVDRAALPLSARLAWWWIETSFEVLFALTYSSGMFWADPMRDALSIQEQSMTFSSQPRRMQTEPASGCSVTPAASMVCCRNRIHVASWTSRKPPARGILLIIFNVPATFFAGHLCISTHTRHRKYLRW